VFACANTLYTIRPSCKPAGLLLGRIRPHSACSSWRMCWRSRPRMYSVIALGDPTAEKMADWLPTHGARVRLHAVTLTADIELRPSLAGQPSSRFNTPSGSNQSGADSASLRLATEGRCRIDESSDPSRVGCEEPDMSTLKVRRRWLRQEAIRQHGQGGAVEVPIFGTF
jgi:hypothetical protein